MKKRLRVATGAMRGGKFLHTHYEVHVLVLRGPSCTRLLSWKLPTTENNGRRHDVQR